MFIDEIFHDVPAENGGPLGVVVSVEAQDEGFVKGTGISELSHAVVV